MAKFVAIVHEVVAERDLPAAKDSAGEEYLTPLSGGNYVAIYLHFPAKVEKL
jgi:hypothetical protein